MIAVILADYRCLRAARGHAARPVVQDSASDTQIAKNGQDRSERRDEILQHQAMSISRKMRA